MAWNYLKFCRSNCVAQCDRIRPFHGMWSELCPAWREGSCIGVFIFMDCHFLDYAKTVAKGLTLWPPNFWGVLTWLLRRLGLSHNVPVFQSQDRNWITQPLLLHLLLRHTGSCLISCLSDKLPLHQAAVPDEDQHWLVIPVKMKILMQYRLPAFFIK